MASSFVSYAAPFNMMFRQNLLTEKWIPDLIERGIPMSQGIMPLDMLTNASINAKWANEGLPTDPLSIENGAIMTNASRWALMIDPQLQVCEDGKWGPGGVGVLNWIEIMIPPSLAHALTLSYHSTPIRASNGS